MKGEQRDERFEPRGRDPRVCGKPPQRLLQQGAPPCGGRALPAEREDRAARDRRSAALRRDMDGDTKPEAVTRLKTAIAAADGVLYVSPEYNYGVPGVLKNAIDWASRPGYSSVLAQKPSAIKGARESIVGTARGQGQLKQVLLACCRSSIRGANTCSGARRRSSTRAASSRTRPRASSSRRSTMTSPRSRVA